MARPITLNVKVNIDGEDLIKNLTSDVESFQEDGVTEVNPASGYFSMYRVSDEEAIIENDIGLSITDNDIYYTMSGANNTKMGFMRYIFTMHYSDGAIQSQAGYVNIIDKA